MNAFENWYLRRLIEREVVQGPAHCRNTARLYEIIRQSWEKEFFEDNVVTLNAQLTECFEASLRKSGTEDLNK